MDKLSSCHLERYVTTMQSKYGTLKRLGLGWGVIKDSSFWRLRFLFTKNHNINHNITISCHNINIRIVTKNNMTPGTFIRQVYHCSTNSITISFLHFHLRSSFDWADSVKPHFEAPRSLSRILHYMSHFLLSSCLGVWKCGQTQSFMFNILHELETH